MNESFRGVVKGNPEVFSKTEQLMTKPKASMVSWLEH